MLDQPMNLISTTLSSNAEMVLAKRYYKKDENGEVCEGSKEMFWRIAATIAEEERKYTDSAYTVEQLALHFYDLMATGTFLPNSPTLMNAGRELGQLSACFVLPIEDSIDSIFDTLKHMAIIQKTGGGTGFSFSNIRPKDSFVGTTGGVASGPLSFMRIFNTATEQIKQGGKRRGANMGVLRIDHPDIIEFIHAKETEGELSNFNLSVGITDKFMDAVENGTRYDIIDPYTNAICRTMDAREVYNTLILKAWISGDPGVVFLDTINKDNPTPEQGDIEATNPCGEVPLLPYEACNLGSINLSNCLTADIRWVTFDWDKLSTVTRLATRFLDNVIDANKYPLEQIDTQVKLNRKIGLGVMGWADALFAMGIGYDTEEARVLGGQVMGFIRSEARKESQLLASERGSFPAFASSSYASEYKMLRNATITTIAPTGTLSIIAGCSSGIEPIFALSFARNVMDGAVLLETNPYFEQALVSAGAYSPDLMNTVASTGSIQNITTLPDTLRKTFVTAMDISAEAHLYMQAAFQLHTDNAVSKTVNLPHSATIEDVEKIYTLAYKTRCKGVTVYRDGCKSVQVLTTGSGAKPPVDKPVAAHSGVVRTRPDIVDGFTQKVQTGLGFLYLTVNEVDGQPFEVFATIGKSGHSITAKTEAIGRLVSLCFRSGVTVKAVVAQLKGIGGEHPVFQNKGMLLSIPDAIAWVLEARYLAGSHVTDTQGLTRPICPDCGAELHFQEGCHHCPGCAYSRCG